MGECNFREDWLAACQRRYAALHMKYTQSAVGDEFRNEPMAKCEQPEEVCYMAIEMFTSLLIVSHYGYSSFLSLCISHDIYMLGIYAIRSMLKFILDALFIQSYNVCIQY
jgi:hypothetical protein